MDVILGFNQLIKFQKKQQTNEKANYLKVPKSSK